MIMREGGDDTGAQLVRFRVRELQRCDLLEVIVQEPGMVDQDLQDQRFAPRDRTALPAEQRTARKLGARRLVRPAADRGSYPQPLPAPACSGPKSAACRGATRRKTAG